MAQDRSTKNISMIKWMRTSRLSIKKSLSEWQVASWNTDADPAFGAELPEVSS